MDLVKVIDKAIGDLPDGPYSPGLKAIQRHVRVAIRHFDREDDGDLDSFTDAIYRCNQAYEGGLKEAYRVLAEEDPAKLTPFKIENYLEDEKLLRPRVLKQLTRYREDYRNPSAHDYRLDFDADEALLAIVSVCAFVKLLLNQISARLAFDEGAAILKNDRPVKFESSTSLAEYIVNVILKAIPESTPRNYSTYAGNIFDFFVEGIISSNGIACELIEEGDDPYEIPGLRVLVSEAGFQIPIDTRYIPGSSLSVTKDYILGELEERDLQDSILVIYGPSLASGLDYNRVYLEKNRRLHVIYPKNVELSIEAADRDAFSFFLSKSDSSIA